MAFSWRSSGHGVPVAMLTENETHQFVNLPKIPVIFINFFDFNFSFFGYSWDDCNSLILILLQISFLKIQIVHRSGEPVFTLSFKIEGSFVGCFIVQLVPQSRILFKCFLYFLLEMQF